MDEPLRAGDAVLVALATLGLTWAIVAAAGEGEGLVMGSGSAEVWAAHPASRAVTAAGRMRTSMLIHSGVPGTFSTERRRGRGGSVGAMIGTLR